jgi:hypothetical protein
MKWTFAAIFTLLLYYPVISQAVKEPQHKLLGVFDGRTPCKVLATYLNEFPGPECIKIKWRLTLFVDSISNEPSRFELIGITYKKENPRVGNWQILKGSHADPQAIVYQLNQSGKPPLLIQKGDNNILFFLDKEKRLLVGNRDFSYTLNRVVQ